MPRLLTGAGVALGLMLTGLFAADIEGHYFPVVSEITLEPAPIPTRSDAETFVYFRATKMRACRFLYLDWVTRTADGEAIQAPVWRVATGYEAAVGDTITRTLHVGLPAEAVRTRSHVAAVHQCPRRPWRTHTVIYHSTRRHPGF